MADQIVITEKSSQAKDVRAAIGCGVSPAIDDLLTRQIRGVAADSAAEAATLEASTAVAATAAAIAEPMADCIE